MNHYYFKKIDENKFIKSKKQLISGFIERRQHELNELRRLQLLNLHTNEISESSLSKTMNTASSSTD
jgi:hypothetical protein